MKIKTVPGDFIVKEIACLDLRDKGSFGCYCLEKSGWNTIELLKHLAKKLSIPFDAIAYGGRKDRQALTWQYITIKGPKVFIPASNTYKLKFIGFTDRPMGPDLIKANDFKIICRDIDPGQEQGIEESIRCVLAQGFPNYFDDQRFGSYDPLDGFLAEKLLKGHFNGALRILLTLSSLDDPPAEKKRKTFLRGHWGAWEQCLKVSATEFEKRCFSHLAKDPKGFLPLLKMVPRSDLSFHFSVYQSHLWNKLLGRIINDLVKNEALRAAGKAGDYLFYTQLDDEKFGYLKNLMIPLACAKTKMPDALSASLYAGILAQEGIRQGMFNSMKVRQSFFCRAYRNALALPEDFFFEWAADGAGRKKKKLTLSFRLAAGCFATMLVKRIFLNT